MALIWHIVALDSTVDTGIINTAHWEASDYEVVDGVTHRGRRYGSIGLEANVDAEGFIPWADVTEETAMAWTKVALGEEEVASIESCIADDIAKSKVPVTTSENPWVVAEQEAANEAALAAIAELEGGE
tara:strand:+ start:567 stop:953 length:387 start_codon:yes stop_codon:yes gene_type:complete